MQMCQGDPDACYLRWRVKIAEIRLFLSFSGTAGITSILSVTAGMR
jgi:hypothetical protein